MSYTVLARRYRSSSFGTVVGQETTATTLRNAIALDKVHHAFLFTGTRGVGKTSMARILACALNAPACVEDCPPPGGQFAYADPDVQERMAAAIMRGDDMNVIEIDGASNNKVEEARQLIVNAGLSPTAQARYKIYIIDEVHMLSTAAFNALLKTMEEPPAHVKFILCTTESQKVPPTIQSRCQRFDFRNIPTASIAEHLKFVIQREAVQVDDQVVWQVARLANGSMRDGLSLLDRVFAAADNEEVVTIARLETLLGLPPQERIDQLIDALATGDVAASLTHTAGLVGGGLAQDQVFEALIERLRLLMLVAACGQESPLVEVGREEREALARQAESFDSAALVYMIALCEQGYQAGRHSVNARALLDATIVRLALAEKMADVAALLRGDSGQKKKVDAPRPAPPRPTATTPSATPADARPPEASPFPEPQNGLSQGESPPADMAPAEDDTWAGVLDAVAEKPSMSWVRSLNLEKLKAGRAYVAPMPGRRELTKFLTPQRCEQLGEVFRKVLGRPVRVEIADPTGPPPPHADKTPPAGDQIDHAKAVSLPTVRQVLDHFNAIVVEARPDQQPATGTAGTTAEGDTAEDAATLAARESITP